MIKFHPRFNELIKSGKKTSTVRMESKYLVGEVHGCVNPNADSRKLIPFAWVKVTKVWDWIEIQLVDLDKEGFAHVDDLIAFLQRAYPQLSITTSGVPVCLVEFELVEEPKS